MARWAGPEDELKRYEHRVNRPQERVNDDCLMKPPVSSVALTRLARITARLAGGPHDKSHGPAGHCFGVTLRCSSLRSLRPACDWVCSVSRRGKNPC